MTAPTRPSRGWRFAWASGAPDKTGWKQYPLPVLDRRRWLDPLAGLVAALAGGLLWRFSFGAPDSVRVGQVVVGWGVVAGVWFHFRQLASRRTPSAALWPAVVIAVTGLGSLNFLLVPAVPRGWSTDFVVEDERGKTVFLPVAERRRITALWRTAALETRLLRPRLPDDVRVDDERLRLYDLADAASIRAMPEAEQKARGDAGDLGLPLLDAARAPAPLWKFRIVKVRLDANPGTRPSATVTATDGRCVLRFRLTRASSTSTEGLTWFLSRDRVEIE